MDQMKQLGYNTHPPAVLATSSSTPGSDAQRHRLLSKNPDLQGLSRLQIMDKIVAYAGPDRPADHPRPPPPRRRRASRRSGTPAAYPEARWIADWTMLAPRYAGNTDGHRRRPAQRAARPGHLGLRRRRERLAAGRRARRQRHPRGQPRLADHRRGRRERATADSDWWGGNLCRRRALPGAAERRRTGSSTRRTTTRASVYPQPGSATRTTRTTCRRSGTRLGLPVPAERSRRCCSASSARKLQTTRRPAVADGAGRVPAGDLDGTAGDQLRAGRSGRGTPTPATPAAS